MTQEQLEKIITAIRKQKEYEEKFHDAFKAVFTEQEPPFLETPLWEGLYLALDETLGLEDFFSWWIWETDCGRDKTKARIWLQGGQEIPVTNAKEILEYVAINYGL